LFAGLIGAAIQRQRELLIPIDESALRRRWVADEDAFAGETETTEKTGDPALDRA
jgi:CTP synthase